MPVLESQPDGVPVWFDLSSSDPAAAATFYGGLFGWDQEPLGVEFGGYSFFTYRDKMIAGLGPKPPGQDFPDVWCTYFQTADIEKAVREASEAGGSVVAGPMDIPRQGFMAIVADPGSDPATNNGRNPQGAVFGLWQPREHKGFQLHMEVGAPCYFELLSTGYGAAVEFYRTVLGREVVTVSDTDEFRYSQLSLPDANPGEGLAGIMDGVRFLPPDVPSHWSIYIGVENADETAAKAAELGGTVIDSPEDTPYGRLATISDPFGAMLKLHQGEKS